MHPALELCTHVFIRNDGVKKPLQARYDGPFKVVARSSRNFTLDIKVKHSIINIDRVKPDFFSTDNQPVPLEPSNPAQPNTSSAPQTSDPAPIMITRSGCRVHFHPKYL